MFNIWEQPKEKRVWLIYQAREQMEDQALILFWLRGADLEFAEFWSQNAVEKAKKIEIDSLEENYFLQCQNVIFWSGRRLIQHTILC